MSARSRYVSGTVLIIAMLFLVLIAQGQETPDTDEDGVADNFDSCMVDPGLEQNNGCAAGVIADLDRDGVPDQLDLCYTKPGEGVTLGCPQADLPSTDFDGDNVLDVFDSCNDVAGLSENSGCPAETVPDFDGDGIGDQEDFCPRQYGDPGNNGCVIDSDEDYIEDQYDACPAEIGQASNYGCPPGVEMPDQDSDGVPDMADNCPGMAGEAHAEGCPDSDGDAVSDPFDHCPDQPGAPELNGCPEVASIVLPVNRTPITAIAVPQITRLNSLTVGAYQAVLGSGEAMALQTPSGVLIYDLTAVELTPVHLDSQGGMVAYSPAADMLVLLNYVDASTIMLWDTATGSTRTFSLEAPNVNALSLSPDGSLLATAHSNYFAPEGAEIVDHSVRVWDTASGTLRGTLAHDQNVYRVAFNPSGDLLISQTEDAVLHVWEAATLAEIGTLQGASPPAFIGDTMAFNGSRLAASGADGSLIIWNTADRTEIARYPLYDPASPPLNIALAFSPDGSLIVVAEAMPATSDPLAQEQTTLKWIDANTGTLLHSVPGIEGAVIALGFSLDGTLLITVSNTSVEFWGVAP